LPTNTATAAPVATAETTGFGAIPQSVNEAGYHVLGRADAPVTINHYSDFL
jgi:hypothetical protein